MINHFKPSIRDIAPLIETAVSSGKEAKLTVTGYSMYPIFRSERDNVVLTAPNCLKKYDVVLYRRANGEYVLHRIIKISGDTLTIAGDNELVKEYPVYSSQVIAKMKSFVRNGREYPASAFWYRAYSVLWLIIFPLRHKTAWLLQRVVRFARKFQKGKR